MLNNNLTTCRRQKWSEFPCACPATEKHRRENAFQLLQPASLRHVVTFPGVEYAKRRHRVHRYGVHLQKHKSGKGLVIID